MGILLTQFLTCSARCQLAWRLNSLVTWQIGSKSSPSLSCGRIRGPQIPKSLSFARLILFPAPPLDPAPLSSLGFVDLGGRLNGRRLRKTLNPLILQKTPGAEERTGAKSPSFLNAQASGVFLAPFSGGFSPRGDLFSFSQASSNPGGGCPDGRGLAQRSVDGLDLRRIVDSEGAVALVTESSGFRSHHECYRGSQVVFQKRQQRDSSETSSFRQSFSNDLICYKRCKNSNPQTFCGGLVRKEHSDQVQASPPPVLESSFLRQKEKWEISADPGSFKVEHLCSDPFICYG